VVSEVTNVPVPLLLHCPLVVPDIVPLRAQLALFAHNVSGLPGFTFGAGCTTNSIPEVTEEQIPLLVDAKVSITVPKVVSAMPAVYIVVRFDGLLNTPSPEELQRPPAPETNELNTVPVT
tara:strand:- start:27 stop:386 length:360 start_codon:yes stop_codon:yes gene_type:complete